MVDQGNKKSADAARVREAAGRLRELEVTGVAPHEILKGRAGQAFIRDVCGGDPGLAIAAFALVHSPDQFARSVRT